MWYDRDFQGAGRNRYPRGSRQYGDEFDARSGPRRGSGGRPYNGNGGDYWWLGERELDRQRHLSHYDEEYARFSRLNRPRFSPVGGMYPPMGGMYARRRPPRGLREPRHFSDWTRWF